MQPQVLGTEGTAQGPTGESQSLFKVRRQREGQGKGLGWSLYWGFRGKGKAGQSQPFF